MACAPLTCCSMGAATDCSTTSALAPGNAVDTVTWGGTTCGYCAIGRPSAASTPTRIMISAMTVEKTGRSMKKLNMARWLDLAIGMRDSVCGQAARGQGGRVQFLFLAQAMQSQPASP